MLFSSWAYAIFLSLVLLLYWRLDTRHKASCLLLASYVFYMCWSPPFGLIYAPVIFLDTLYFYWLGRAMVRFPDRKKQILVLGVTSELLLLGYFKYSNLMTSSLESVAQWANIPFPHLEFNVFLPLAISFTNFILISYLVDVYRGKEQPDKPFKHFAAYVAFFPHLIAGPIVRASELIRQFENPLPFSGERLVQGIHLFFKGLMIKVFIADLIAPYVDLIYSNPELQGFDTNWVATYGFAIQIFCDFWGYTLMAQGSALMLGYTLPENFNAPYFASNISEFWRRWHMSLSRWLKDYLYIPLGGSKGSKLATYRNLFITMGLGGLWHGASWNFMIWGLYHGLLLSLHKACSYLKLNQLLPRLLAIGLTFHMVCLGWVFFRAQGLPNALNFISAMFNPLTAKGLSEGTVAHLEQGAEMLSGDMVLLIVILFLSGHALYRKFGFRIIHPVLHPQVRDYSLGFAYCILLYLGVTMTTSSQQFIYFQF